MRPCMPHRGRTSGLCRSQPACAGNACYARHNAPPLFPLAFDPWKAPGMTDFAPYDRQSFEREIEQTLVSDMAAFARLSQRSGMHCHALVDAAACGQLDEQRPDEGAIARLAARHPVEATPLFLLTPEADIAGAGPWLIELPVSEDGEAVPALLSDLARVAGLAQALSLMASPLRSTTLAIHLRGWFDGRIPADPTIADDEDAGAVLRWYDPRVGFDMVALWPEADRDAFLSAFTWAGWDAAFTPRGLRCTRSRDPRAAPRPQPMTLGTDLLRAMGVLSHHPRHPSRRAGPNGCHRQRGCGDRTDQGRNAQGGPRFAQLHAQGQPDLWAECWCGLRYGHCRQRVFPDRQCSIRQRSARPSGSGRRPAAGD
ncbi:MAG: hypothetical protein DI563_26120 [Variovorax paradoxus]|uniref:DUF4123 domain-containing protein n=1 Tax=Variovorax paradoxus TaxID=34073 RepID=A0A2W5PHU7_VARPD|nr:MAG: hypothetical protein DI563_26120 [Variovorax paradoxus]